MEKNINNFDDMFSTEEIVDAKTTKTINDFTGESKGKSDYRNIFILKRHIETETQKGILINLPFTNNKKIWLTKQFAESYSKSGKPYIRYGINLNADPMTLIDENGEQRAFPVIKIWDAYQKWENNLLEQDLTKEKIEQETINQYGFGLAFFETLKNQYDLYILQKDIMKMKSFKKQVVKVASENEDL